jgi:hypothetical protein
LEPDKTSDLAKYEFYPRSPWSRNIVTYKFHAVLYRSLQASQQFRLLIESRCNHHPNKYDGQRTKRVNLYVMLDACEAIIGRC